jgi:hypothetical protein
MAGLVPAIHVYSWRWDGGFVHSDLALWADSQARALRDAGHAGTNLLIDWANVAEEIEALGRSQASPASEPRGGWRESIAEQRSEIERLIEDWFPGQA